MDRTYINWMCLRRETCFDVPIDKWRCNGSKLQEKANDAAKEADTAKAAWVCRICLSAEVNMTIVPCGHVLCRRCSAAVSRCPFCRLQVTKTMKIFRPWNFWCYGSRGLHSCTVHGVYMFSVEKYGSQWKVISFTAYKSAAKSSEKVIPIGLILEISHSPPRTFVNWTFILIKTFSWHSASFFVIVTSKFVFQMTQRPIVHHGHWAHPY